MKSALKLKDKTHSKGNLKFAGPLKILVIEAKGEYYKTVWCAIGLGLVNVMIGAVNMTALLYSARTADSHCVICTIAYHFFCAQAILSLNYANGWSTPMRLRHRKLAHVMLQISGMTIGVTGTAVKLTSDWPPSSAHGITGVTVAFMGCVNVLTGICALCEMHYGKMFHIAFGMATFIMSSLSMCLGFFTANIKDWIDINIIVVLTCFIVFYTIFIGATVIIKFLSKI